MASTKANSKGRPALGLSPFQTLFLVSLPQALRNAIPTIGNEWVVNIKDSSVLNVIGVTELYFMSGQAANKNYMFMASYLIIALIYLLLTLHDNADP
jgi:putative lysine transport system permease protein